MARPGTIDYSKWDRLAADISSDEDSPPKRVRSNEYAAVNPFQAAPDRVNFPYLQEYRESACELDDDVESEFDDNGSSTVQLQTGTCLQCGTDGAQKRCSRCQAVWFCDSVCQAAAWKLHSVACFAKSETDTWWGILGNSTELASKMRDPTLAHQQRLDFRRAVAVTRERCRAAAAAAARAAALREQAGENKGGDAKGGKGGEGREETCAVCQCEFTVEGDSGEGICCPSSHFLCSECTGVFVQSIMNDLEASFPPKCSMCRGEIPVESFERHLSTRQHARYAEFVAQQALAKNEHIVKCNCGYMEVREDRPVLWWCPVCKHGECQVCNKELPPMDDTELRFFMDADSSSNASEVDVLMRPHVVGCASLRDAKAKVDMAFTNGQKMPCPQCGLSGMKDDACTHMSCPRCRTPWCYVCGLAVDACDKAPPRVAGRPTNDIFLHNVDWDTNPLRCPMFLTEVLEVDPAWLGQNWDQGDEVDDDRCLSYFHRWRTIKLLQDARRDMGEETFENVWLHFESVRNSGYELEEIVHTDTSVLIDREAWQERSSDESYSEEDEQGD